MNRLSQLLRIGGVGIRFDGCSSDALTGPFADFAGEGEPEVIAQVRSGASESHASQSSSLTFDAHTWALFERDRGHRLELYVRPGGTTRVAIAADISRDWSALEVAVDHGLLPPSTAAAPVVSPLGELTLMSRLTGRGLYVHASAAWWEDGVDLFLGPSGAGKTTLAGLAVAQGATVLSDDRTVLRFENGELVAYGTPFHGQGRHWSNRRGPVRGLFFLEHAPRTSFSPLPATPATAHLAALTFTQHWDRDALERTLHLCELAIALVPAHRLLFRPDGSAIDAIVAARDR